jgi:predicted transcriptional regulator YheO
MSITNIGSDPVVATADVTDPRARAWSPVARAVALLLELDRSGVFSVRRAVPVLAGALRMSRSTVYALLAELRARRNDA